MMLRKTINNCYLFITLMMFIPSHILAADILEQYMQCVDSARSELMKPTQRNAYKNRGCKTDFTNWKNERSSCNENICWDAPPNNRITDSKVWSHSANGSEHTFDETKYLPTRDAATKICNYVHARSTKLQDGNERGWQKISADVTLERQITSAETEKIESDCKKKVLKL